MKLGVLQSLVVVVFSVISGGPISIDIYKHSSCHCYTNCKCRKGLLCVEGSCQLQKEVTIILITTQYRRLMRAAA